MQERLGVSTTRNDFMKAALVGFGAVARYGHLSWYLKHPSVRLTSVVEPTPLGRTVVRDLLPHVQVFSSLEELLNSQKVTFVDIVAPPATHSELVLRAATAGIHIICEKPFATSWHELQQINSVRQQAGSIIAACHNWYFAPVIRRGLELVDAGLIGEPRRVCFTARRPQPARGVDYWKPEWRQCTSEGGGIIGDLGYHGMYLAGRIFQRAVNSVQTNSIHVASTVDGAESIASVELDYGEGRRAELMLSWLSDIRETMLHVYGSQGCLIINGDSLRLVIFGKKDIEERFDSLTADSWHAAWIGETLDCFLGALERGDQDAYWQDIEWSVSALEGAYASVRSGVAVATPAHSPASPPSHGS
jgi:predicted dehydrogenase